MKFSNSKQYSHGLKMLLATVATSHSLISTLFNMRHILIQWTPANVTISNRQHRFNVAFQRMQKSRWMWGW